MLAKSITGPLILILNLAGLLAIAGYASLKMIKRWRQKAHLASADHAPLDQEQTRRKSSSDSLFSDEDDLFDDLDLSEFDELSLDDFDK